MKILGISSGSDSGVVLFEDDRMVLGVNEERLSRRKLDDAYPHRSLRWILAESGLKPADIGMICHGFAGGLPGTEFFTRMMRRALDYAGDPAALPIILERLATEGEVDAVKNAEFLRETRAIFPDTPIHTCHHHEAHACSAYLASPFERALVVTADGRGDYLSLTISAFTPEGKSERYTAYSWESLGYLYGRVTHLCGFKPNRHEGKITGLAAHGDPEKAIGLMRRMIRLDDEGRLRSSPGPLYRPFFSNFSPELLAEAARFTPADLAAAVQRHLEDLLCGLVRRHVAESGLTNICVAGGVFSNVRANQKLRDLPGVSDLFIYPNMGDGGICAGGVHHYLYHVQHRRPVAVPSLYVGPAIDPERIAALLRAKGLAIERPVDLESTVVDLLADHQAIGLVQGRNEFGPRALGNRSIIAACDRADVCQQLNDRLARTEFMPFAPSIASNLAGRALKGYRDQFSARHMTITYEVAPALAEGSPAIVHLDGTARPQVVFPEDNPLFHRLLNRWHERSGQLCLMNTSFNMHEEPIVCGEDDIVSTFTRGAVDCLLFAPYLCRLPKGCNP